MKSMILFGFIVYSILHSSVLFSKESTQDKLTKLESKFIKLQQQIDQLKKDVSVSGTGLQGQRVTSLENYALQLYDALTELQEEVQDNNLELTRISNTIDVQPKISLYGTTVASKASNKNSIIDGQSFEIVISGQPHKRISYFSELEFERAATVGGARGGEVLVEQAYTDVQVNSWMNIRAGIILVPFGNIERDHYAPIRDVISKPYTSLALAPSDWTDNGFGLNGKLNLSGNWMVDYQLYVISGLDSNLSTTGLRSSRQGFGVDNNHNKAIASKITMQNTTGLSLGLSYYNGAWNDSGSKDIVGYNIDVDYQWRWLEFIGEYTKMGVEREFNGTAIMDGFYLRSIFSLEDLFSQNWLSNDFPHAKLSFITQYDQVNIENVFDKNIRDNWEKRYTLGLKIQPNYSWRANLNYEHAWSADLETILRGNSDVWSFSVGYLF